ncbi:MAG: tRNA 4-thiouridine(8) synthase ThiI [Firmicutes bacterium]|nr:tRNA 4-thiouridine(8) synthase ThiI [Bacillota bacterium]
MADKLLLRFGEVGLKGKNRSYFINALIANVRRALAPVLGDVRITSPYGRIFVDLPDNCDLEDVRGAMQRVFGLVSCSPVQAVALDMDSIRAAALAELKSGEPATTFKVDSRRALKTFPLNSQEINQELGGFLLQNCPGVKVDIHNPQRTVSVEVRREGAFVFSRIWPGPGGMPVGVTGKGVLLLSGGIDSPVAGWLAMKRGIALEALYFDTPPFTSPRALAKVEKLARQLSRYGPVNLHVVNFTAVQQALMETTPEDLTITVMRRFMYRVAEALAKRKSCLALITGESVAQVASQTLESIQVINDVVRLPVLRPVVTMDKVEIVELARRIETYETSVEPYQDCCALFVSKHPKTRPTLKQAEAAESGLDVDDLVQTALKQINTKTYKDYAEEEVVT